VKIVAEMRLKHGVLRELREKYGTLKRVAELIGAPYQTLCNWAALRAAPTAGQYKGAYTEEIEQNLVLLSGVPAGEIFPPALREAIPALREGPELVREVELAPEALLELARRAQERLEAPDPARGAMVGELRERMLVVLSELPVRSQHILCMRYGLAPYTREHTQREVGKKFGVEPTRISQLEQRAIRELQQPSRSQLLVGFVPEGRPSLSSVQRLQDEAANKSIHDIAQEREQRRHRERRKDGDASGCVGD